MGGGVGLIGDASRAIWWVYPVVASGFGLALWPLTKKRVHVRWLLAVAVLGLVLATTAGPWLVSMFVGHSDAGAGKRATETWMFAAAFFAVVGAFATGALAARLWSASIPFAIPLALAALAVSGVVSIMFVYVVLFALEFSVEGGLL